MDSTSWSCARGRRQAAPSPPSCPPTPSATCVFDAGGRAASTPPSATCGCCCWCEGGSVGALKFSWPEVDPFDPRPAVPLLPAGVCVCVCVCVCTMCVYVYLCHHTAWWKQLVWHSGLSGGGAEEKRQRRGRGPFNGWNAHACKGRCLGFVSITRAVETSKEHKAAI